MDSSTPIRAADIVDNPDTLQTLEERYIIIYDSSWGGTFRNMIKAINILDQYGWETKSIAHSQGVMYALIERFKDRS
ncbi:MAG: hypothetical protein CUN55_18385 [Phototrophicales bacterium]|nr:MAG: hypothetical protein CUN55_18385 [Phototrophicales bacterium]RMG87061.1 MAG: hypothetical protein D6712_06350 [Chloroflexota bacterium]